MAGATLVELLLVAGVIVSGTAIVLAVAHNTQVQSKRSQAQKDVQALQSRLLSGYRNQSNFDNITTESARADGLFPSSMLDPVNGQPRTPWGGAITIAGVSSPGSSLNDSLVVAMEDVPGRDCAETASSLAAGFSDIRVNGISVGAGGNLDVARLAEACSGRSSNRLELFWNNPNASETSNWCVGDGTHQTRSLTCPPGQLGTIHESRVLSCPDLYADPVPGPWTEVSNTCAPECVVPSPAVQTQERPGPSCPAGQLGEIVESRTLTYSCPAPTGSPDIAYSAWTVSSNTCAPICNTPMPKTDHRTLSCPPGQLGEIIEEQVTTYTCPAPTGDPTSTASPWTVVSNTCAPECVAPSAKIETQNETGTCPATMVTPSGSRTYPHSRTATTTYTCPAPTGDYVAEPTTYSSWSPSASQACAPECVLPNPRTQTDRETRTGTQTLSCPPGQLGEIRQSQPQERTRTRTASCPAPTGSPTWGSWSTWSAWAGTGLWSTTSNTCAPACVLPSPSTQTRAGTAETRSVTESRTVTVYEAGSPARQTLACPAGQLGQIIQERPTRRSRTATQTRTQPQTRTTTQTRTATCPAPTGDYKWSSWSSPGAPYGAWTNSGSASSWSSSGAPYGSWSGYSQHESWSTISNTCAPACVLPNPSTQTRAGTPETRNLTESQTVTVYEAGSPASQTIYNCPAGRYGHSIQQRPTRRSRTATQTRTQPQTRTTTQTRTASCPAPTGSYVWGSWSAPGAPYGSWSNNGSASSWSSPGAPYGAWSGYSQHGSWATTSTNCTACPASSNSSTEWRWNETYTQNCSAGQYGIITRQRQQERKQTRSYNCPEGTRTLPSPTYTWGGWYNNGETRLNSNTCQSCPSLSPESQTTTSTETRWVVHDDCRNRQQTRSRTGTRTRSRSYNCPAGTTSLPPISYGTWSGYSYGSWGSWSNTSNYQNRSNNGTETRNLFNCPAGQTVVTPEVQQRTWTCSSGSKTYGSWQTIALPQCCPQGMTCQIQ